MAHKHGHGHGRERVSGRKNVPPGAPAQHASALRQTPHEFSCSPMCHSDSSNSSFFHTVLLYGKLCKYRVGLLTII